MTQTTKYGCCWFGAHRPICGSPLPLLGPEQSPPPLCGWIGFGAQSPTCERSLLKIVPEQPPKIFCGWFGAQKPICWRPEQPPKLENGSAWFISVPTGRDSVQCPITLSNILGLGIMQGSAACPEPTQLVSQDALLQIAEPP